jgi:hypothetical protein
LAKGLDEVHPFSDTARVEVLLREANDVLSLHVDALGRKDASRIWGFMSKFAMLDRFSKTLGVEQHYPGIQMPRNLCSPEYLGTGSKVSDLH